MAGALEEDVLHEHEADDVVEVLLVDRHARVLLLAEERPQVAERGGRRGWRRCRGAASSPRAPADRKSTSERNSSRASVPVARPGVGPRPRRLRGLRLRSSVSAGDRTVARRSPRRHATSVRDTGRTRAAITANDGSRSSSTRCGLRRTMSSGSSARSTRPRTPPSSPGTPRCRARSARRPRRAPAAPRTITAIERRAAAAPGRTAQRDRRGSAPSTVARPAALSAISRSDSRISALKAASIVAEVDGGAGEQEDRAAESSSRVARSIRPRAARPCGAAAPRRRGHLAVVVLVVVAEQVQQAVQRQHPQLGGLGVPGAARAWRRATPVAMTMSPRCRARRPGGPSSSAGNDRTSVAPVHAAVLAVQRASRASLTSTTVTAPRARAGAVDREPAGQPGRAAPDAHHACRPRSARQSRVGVHGVRPC